MTVGELINLLKEVDPNKEIRIDSRHATQLAMKDKSSVPVVGLDNDDHDVYINSILLK